MADVRDKLTALHSLVETTLQAHDATYKVYDRPRQLFLDAKSRAKRVSIMGDPIRYAEVTLDSIQADAEPMTRLADGRAIAALSTQAGRTIDRFNIEVLWEYEDAATLAASSYADFLDAVVSKDGSTKSLVGKLRETAYLTATAGVNDTLKATLTGGDALHDIRQTVAFTPGNTVSVSLDYFIPEGQSVNAIVVSDSGFTELAGNNNTVGEWATFTGSVTATNGTSIRIYANDGSPLPVDADGDVFYIKNVVVQDAGSTIYTSDFSAGADSWTGTNMTATGNVDDVPFSEIVSLDNPTIVDLQWIPVDMTGSIYAHYALITIDVI